jgi:hypothetical protein
MRAHTPPLILILKNFNLKLLYIFYTEKFPVVLLHATDPYLNCFIQLLYSLMKGQKGLKYEGVGGFYKL